MFNLFKWENIYAVLIGLFVPMTIKVVDQMRDPPTSALMSILVSVITLLSHTDKEAKVQFQFT